LIKISPDPSRSIESGSSTNEWWNTWEVVSECFSSNEILVLKEIVDVASLRPFEFFGSSTHGLISSHHFSESLVNSMLLPSKNIILYPSPVLAVSKTSFVMLGSFSGGFESSGSSCPEITDRFLNH
jgi:hypothetical protein